MDVNWALVGKVMASNYRTIILKLLSKGVLMPKQLATKTEKNITHVSRTLKELETLGLVECLNPKARKGKLYSLTTQGEGIIAEIKE